MTLFGLNASSATTGFFQTLPTIPPQFQSSKTENDDPVLSRLLTIYIGDSLPQEVNESLDDLAKICVLASTQRLTVDADVNIPTLHPLNTFGDENVTDALRTGEGWRKLKQIAVRVGSVGWGYGSTPSIKTGTFNRRVHQYAVNHLWSGSAAMVTCPAAMTDGAAMLLGEHTGSPDGDQPGRARVLAQARERLISFDPEFAWTSGQWMTERTGGSDVSQTETRAQRLDDASIALETQMFGSQIDSVGMPLGPWSIDGFKWFSSATDADMVILLARTDKGLSLFYAPMRRAKAGVSIMNGVRISRLKNKLGTKGLPTSELEIKGMRAWLIGEEGKGTKEISHVLNCTRLWTACVGSLARGLAIARAFARVRIVRQKLLVDNPQHMSWMAQETVRYRASAHLAFLGAALLGLAEQGQACVKGRPAHKILPSSQEEAKALLRTLTPVMKAQCSLTVVNGLRACMESLGGIGYCENNEDGGIMNVARLFRDANVSTIWEGTTSVMAEDLVRALKGREQSQGMRSVHRLIERMNTACKASFGEYCEVVERMWDSVATQVYSQETEQLLYHGRTLLEQLESILCSYLLMYDALIDSDPVARAVAMRWMDSRLPISSRMLCRSDDLIRMDRRIFVGQDVGAGQLRANI